MTVLNVSTDDFANFAHDNAKALRSVGVDCLDFKTEKHVFKYESESQIKSIKEMIWLARSFDVVQIFHSDIKLLEALKNHAKRIVVYHTGSRYRQNPQRFNRLFNPHVETSIIALCEFAGLGSKNEKYVVGAVDFNEFIEPRKIGRSKVVAHYPSNPQVKGTDEIIKMMSNVSGCIFDYSVSQVSYKQQLERISQCDIYIELFKPTLDGKQYGSWGITALEAAAMGKVVVTQNLSHDVYMKNYPYCPLVLCDNQTDFVGMVQSLCDLSDKELKHKQQMHLDWINDNHSYISTGERLIQILGI